MSSEDLFERPVFIVGLPRSGTSLVTGMLQRCGLWLGRTVPGDAFNPEGYFENAALREGIVKPILRRLGVDPLGVHALPPLDAALAVPALKAMVLDALRRQDYEGSSRWGYKGNKLALIWQLWDTHFPRADWIIVQRSTADVIASCMNTPFMAQHSSDPMFWRDFVARRAARLEELCASHVMTHEIDAGALIAGDFDNMQRLVESLGLNWTAAARDFVNPRLWQTWRRESRDAG